jgi:hypothetical protein
MLEASVYPPKSKPPEVRCFVCGKAAEMESIFPGFCMRDYYSLKIGRRLFDQIATNRLDFTVADPPQIFLAVAHFFEVKEVTFIAAIEKAKERKNSNIFKKAQEEEMWGKENVSPGCYMRDFYALNMGWRIFDQIIMANSAFGMENPNDLFDIIAEHFEISVNMVQEVIHTATNQKLARKEANLEKEFCI